METIYHLLDVPAHKRPELMKALTTREGLAGWWTTKTKQPEENIWRFHFGNDYHKDFRIVEESEDHIEWKCEAGAPDWLDTHISFDIEKQDDKLMVRFRHSGWKDQNDMFGLCNYHWALYMKSLKDLVETGKGQPTGVE